jgi:hypothetical protein
MSKRRDGEEEEASLDEIFEGWTLFLKKGRV